MFWRAVTGQGGGNNRADDAEMAVKHGKVASNQETHPKPNPGPNPNQVGRVGIRVN